jgi:hypothetical protein
MATVRSPSKQDIKRLQPLSKQDITELRRELAQGQTPRVWFTHHVVRLPPGGSARVVHIDTPAEGDFIHAKPAGRPDDPWRGDTLTFGQEELSRTKPTSSRSRTSGRPRAGTTRHRGKQAVTPKADARPSGSTKRTHDKSGPDRARAGTESEPAAIRAWARAQGMAISDRGRIPAEIQQAYAEACRSSTPRRPTASPPAASLSRSRTPTASLPSDRHDAAAARKAGTRRSARPAKPTRRKTSPKKPKAAAKQDSAAIRAWARAHGIRIPDGGRIPAEIRQVYNQVH